LHKFLQARYPSFSHPDNALSKQRPPSSGLASSFHHLSPDSLTERTLLPLCQHCNASILSTTREKKLTHHMRQLWAVWIVHREILNCTTQLVHALHVSIQSNTGTKNITYTNTIVVQPAFFFVLTSVRAPGPQKESLEITGTEFSVDYVTLALPVTQQTMSKQRTELKSMDSRPEKTTHWTHPAFFIHQLTPRERLNNW